MLNIVTQDVYTYNVHGDGNFCSFTVKFLNFGMPEIFAVIYPKFKQRPNLRVFCQKHANGTANSEDPDQTAPLGAV